MYDKTTSFCIVLHRFCVCTRMYSHYTHHYTNAQSHVHTHTTHTRNGKRLSCVLMWTAPPPDHLLSQTTVTNMTHVLT